jgi:hypothetical protein
MLAHALSWTLLRMRCHGLSCACVVMDSPPVWEQFDRRSQRICEVSLSCEEEENMQEALGIPTGRGSAGLKSGERRGPVVRCCLHHPSVMMIAVDNISTTRQNARKRHAVPDRERIYLVIDKEIRVVVVSYHLLRNIWGFHGGDYEEWCLLGCYAARLL